MDDPAENNSSSYPTTQWTVIIDVIQKGPSAAAWAALAEFCEYYRPAVYTFFRRQNINHHTAEEYTQEFFLTRIHEKWDMRDGFLFKADRDDNSKFRCFLCTVLRRFLMDKWRKKTLPQVEDPNPILATLEMAADTNSERFMHAFDRTLANQIIKKAAGYSTHSKYLLAHFRGEMTQAEAAKALKIEENAFKQSFARFRERFRKNLWKEVEKLVGPDKTDVEAEIRHLVSIFASPSK